MNHSTFLCLLMLTMLIALTNSGYAQNNAKHPLPSKEEQKEMLETAKELYADSLSGDKGKAEVLSDILKTASETKDASEKLALLQLAIEVFPESGTPKAYIEIVKELNLSFDSATEIWVSGFNPRQMPKDKASEVHDVYGELITLCLKDNQFDHALKLARDGSSYIRSKDRSLSKEATARMKMVRVAQAEYKKVQPALKQLETNPDNASANTTVGKYLCFVRGDWKAGLGHLAKGDDKELRGLAESELAEPSEAGDQVALADAWVKVAKKERVYEDTINQHAAGWYQKALPSLTGFKAKKVEKFLKMVSRKDKSLSNDENGEASHAKLPDKGIVGLWSYKRFTIIIMSDGTFVSDNDGMLKGKWVVDTREKTIKMNGSKIKLLCKVESPNKLVEMNGNVVLEKHTDYVKLSKKDIPLGKWLFRERFDMEFKSDGTFVSTDPKDFSSGTWIINYKYNYLYIDSRDNRIYVLQESGKWINHANGRYLEKKK